MTSKVPNYLHSNCAQKIELKHLGKCVYITLPLSCRTNAGDMPRRLIIISRDVIEKTRRMRLWKIISDPLKSEVNGAVTGDGGISKEESLNAKSPAKSGCHPDCLCITVQFHCFWLKSSRHSNFPRFRQVAHGWKSLHFAFQRQVPLQFFGTMRRLPFFPQATPGRSSLRVILALIDRLVLNQKKFRCPAMTLLY